MPRPLRIFISSPADVPDERLRADLIIDKLSQEYSRFFRIESYRWEHEAMLASAHFQDAIEAPSSFDIVVLIIWSRLGTPLPERTADREYRGIDGRSPVTGTEWEYEEALKAARERKAPDLLAFRNISPAPIDTRDAEARARSNAQLDSIDQFWKRHFADRGMFLAAYDEYRTLGEFAQRFEQSLRKLIERRIKDAAGAQPGAEPIWLGDPFRGLQSYEFEHAPIFFGRDAAVAKATEQLAGNARAGHAFLLISAASGSGKSSLVKAGIVPRLMRPQRISGVGFLRRCVFRPGSESADVFLGLAKALACSNAGEVGLPELIAPGQHADQLAAHLRGSASDPSYLFANALGRVTEAERKSGRLLAFENAKLILVVDQLEELLTSTGINPEDRRLLIELLSGLARSETTWVIATLRADFWHRAAEIPELIELTEGIGRVDLAVPSPAELTEMIRKPAQAAGLSFEAHAESGLGLDSVLAEDAATAPGALPLLSFTLDELYKDAHARGNNVLTHASYQALGGLHGSIARRADQVLIGLPPTVQAALPRVLRELTTVSEATDQMPVTRTVPLDSFAESSPARTLIEAFIGARLLVAASETGAAATVRLAHEALIGRWLRARDQLAADRRDLQTRALLERQFERWRQARGRARWLLLLRNPDLANAVHLAKRWGEELQLPLRDFIARSARRARLAQTFTAAAAVLFALVAGGALFEEKQASRQAYNARQRQIGQLAELANGEALHGDLDSALRLGSYAVVQGLALGPNGNATGEARSALANTMWQTPWRLILKNTRPMMSGAFSPDGKRVATGSPDDDGVTIWDSASGQKLSVLNCWNGQNPAGRLVSVNFSPDGRRLVAGAPDLVGQQGMVCIWDLATGKQTGFLDDHLKDVNTVVFSSDGARILTASHEGWVLVWDAATGNQVLAFQDKELDESLPQDMLTAQSAALSPDGLRIVTATSEGVYISSGVSGALITRLAGEFVPFNCAAFSPDGNRIATGEGNKLLLWDASNGKLIATLRGHNGDVLSVVFSPDGKRLLSASWDGTARVWDTEKATELRVLQGNEGAVNAALFSPDGSSILTVSSNDARIWDTQPNKSIEVLTAEPIKASPHHGDNDDNDDTLGAAVYSPDGTRIVAGSSNGAVRVWDVRTRKILAVLNADSGAIGAVAISPNGRRIAAASGDDDAIHIWNAETGAPSTILRGHKGPVNTVSFSPDGDHILTASDDHTARIWDVTTGQQIRVITLDDVKVLSSAVFSPDGKRILTAAAPIAVDDNSSDEAGARLWDAKTGEPIADVSEPKSSVQFATFSPDGARIVTLADGLTITIRNGHTGSPEFRLQADPGIHFELVSFSPDGSRLLALQSDGTIKIWDAEVGRLIGTRQLQAQTFASFSPDGRNILVLSGKEMTAQILDVSAATMSATELVAKVCTKLLGESSLNPDEVRLAGYPAGTTLKFCLPSID